MNKFLRLGLVFVLAAGLALCYDFTGLKPEGYVSDYAHVLDPGRRAELERYCAGVERSTGAQLALVTLPTLEGEPLEDVANALFRKWGIGQKGKNEGLLLLLVTGDRRMRLEVGYGLEPIIPDGNAGSILRTMRPFLREQRYGDALLEAAQGIGSRIAQAKGVQLEGRPLRRSQRRQEFPYPIVLFLGGIGVFALLSSLFGRRGGGSGPGGLLSGLIIGSLLGRGFGSSSGGGGFGGYDSGDSFGGFGGGDSGGGGASSGW